MIYAHNYEHIPFTALATFPYKEIIITTCMYYKLKLLICYSLVMTSKGEWVVGDTLDTDGLNNEDYKSKYQQQLQVCLEENQRPRKGDTADTEQTIQALRRTLQEKENEKVRDAQRFRQQLEQKEREEAEKEERYRHQLQEKERQNTESK